MQAGKTRTVIAAGAIGNVLEWYDFAIYGYFASSIGRAFFPKEDPVAQVLSAFGIFAVGFLMRPIGGALVGYIGDKLGRRAALTFSVTAMAIPTFLVGVLPGHDVLGVLAPIALTLLRMLQGLSVGGEYTTSIVFMVEHAPPGRRGLIGAMGCCGAIGGILLGSATGALLSNVLPADAMQAWGWRIPFLLGLVVGLAGFFLRRHLDEGAVPQAAGHSPLRETVSKHGWLLARLAGLSVFNAVGFYLLFVYIVSWLELADGIAPAHALEINSLSMLVLLPCMVGMGALSDRVGRKPVLLAATGGTARHSLALEHAMRPLFAYLGAATVPTAVFAAAEDWGTGGGPLDTGLVDRIARAARELGAAIEAQPAARPANPFDEPTPFEQLLRAGE